MVILCKQSVALQSCLEKFPMIIIIYHLSIII